MFVLYYYLWGIPWIIPMIMIAHDNTYGDDDDDYYYYYDHSLLFLLFSIFIWYLYIIVSIISHFHAIFTMSFMSQVRVTAPRASRAPPNAASWLRRCWALRRVGWEIGRQSNGKWKLETLGNWMEIWWIIELDDGKIYRKALYLMVKPMVSCRFSLKPIQWMEIGWKLDGKNDPCWILRYLGWTTFI